MRRSGRPPWRRFAASDEAGGRRHRNNGQLDQRGHGGRPRSLFDFLAGDVEGLTVILVRSAVARGSLRRRALRTPCSIPATARQSPRSQVHKSPVQDGRSDRGGRRASRQNTLIVQMVTNALSQMGENELARQGDGRGGSHFYNYLNIITPLK
jgi:hypothetical protein